MTCYVGVDLAWGTRGRTGVAVLDAAGGLVALGDARSDSEVLARMAPWTQGACLVAFDAPLVVPNATGRRRCEAELTADFGRYDAGAHPSSRSRPELADGSRALRLAEALGLDVDPAAGTARRAIEVYPHPALVALFRLDRTLKYKHKQGRDLAGLRAESLRLVTLLESLAEASPPLDLDRPGWHAAVHVLRHAPTKARLRAVEDVVDAVVCGYVALFADLRPDDTTTYGTVAEGYIVTPSLPTDAPPPRPRAAGGRSPGSAAASPRSSS